MGKNIVIFADGTGQRGGMFVDERRSNIYKLYRATRCGPDSSVNPSGQSAFYDPGLGTLPGGIDSPAAAARSLYNLASQATGLGITKNITDCYAEIIRRWEPGDRIFLFGFSRGAYTARCLAGVLKLCGVPTVMADGSPLRRDAKSTHRLARDGVLVYNFTNSRPLKDASPRQLELLRQRGLAATRFRTRHRSDGENGGNARPYFIGVFDTVASLANPAAIAGLSAGALLVIALLSIASLWLPFDYWQWFGALTAATFATAFFWNFATRIKVAFGLPGVRWWQTLHIATARMKMYDTELDQAVSYARQAISIDEQRPSFARVPWGRPDTRKSGTPVWFEQVWFAGNHSDVGGSYPEDESRLSDISLDWMAKAATAVGLDHDPTVLRTYADPLGTQHDETRGLIFRVGGKKSRSVRPDAPLHESVLARFAAPVVLQYDVLRPYRPEALRHHQEVSQYYEIPATLESSQIASPTDGRLP